MCKLNLTHGQATVAEKQQDSQVTLGGQAGDGEWLAYCPILHRRDSENAEIPELSAYGAERSETDDRREPGG